MLIYMQLKAHAGAEAIGPHICMCARQGKVWVMKHCPLSTKLTKLECRVQV